MPVLRALDCRASLAMTKENMETPAPLYALADFAAQLPPRGRLMGLDVGTTTIGVAISDGMRMVASGDITIARRKWSDDAKILSAMIEEQQIAGTVIGYPLNMDGTAGVRAQATRAFARNFLQKFALPVLLWDERLSTAAVTRMMIEGDLSRARRAELVDKLAASYILQGVLDGLGR
jgi:putative Holliday junction resolvase